MTERLVRSAILLAGLFPAVGFAQALPADCSAASVPAQPVSISVGGAKVAPAIVTLRESNHIKVDGKAFDTYRLTFRSEDKMSPSVEAEAVVAVAKGQRVDGKVFRKLPVKDSDQQPAAGNGLPEVQGWSLKNRPAQADLSHVSYIGSLRLEFGQRKGKAIEGKIYLCVPKGQKTIFDDTPSKDDGVVVGSFEAGLE